VTQNVYRKSCGWEGGIRGNTGDRQNVPQCFDDWKLVNVPIYRQFFQCIENAADGVWAEFASLSLTSMRSMRPFANGRNLPHVVIRQTATRNLPDEVAPPRGTRPLSSIPAPLPNNEVGAGA